MSMPRGCLRLPGIGATRPTQNRPFSSHVPLAPTHIYSAALLSTPRPAAAQSFRGATIVPKEEEAGAPPMQEGVWYGPEALMPWELEFHDKKASVGYLQL